MKLYLKAILVTVIAGLVLTSLFWFWKEKTRVPSEDHLSQIDEMETKGLPDFELKNLDGQSVKLSQFKGKVVLVNFWATWCGPCLEEVPSLIELVEAMDGQVELLAVSEDSSREEVEVFLRAFPKIKNPHIHILLDSDHAVGKIYEADRLPETYVTDTELRLVRKVFGSLNWSSKEAISFMKEIIEKPKK
jgi:thiol-disulfide isomerase/thioredoxin